MNEKKVRKVKKGKNCIFWSFSDKKQFFPFCYNSIFGFYETRSSNLLKDYLAKGLTIFNTDFYKDKSIIKNYESKLHPENIFASIYSNRFIRALTTYCDYLEKYQNPEFFKFYSDNTGYSILNTLIFEIQKKVTNFYYLCSKEKENLLIPLSLNSKKFSLNELFEKSYSKSTLNKQSFLFETYPYWFSIDEIRQIENYYFEHQSEIENFNNNLSNLYNFYLNKFYSGFQKDAIKIINRYINIQKAWIYLIGLIKKNGNYVILDGSFADFKVFPFLAGFLPQNKGDEQIFDIYIFGDNLTFGMGKNILILNSITNLIVKEEEIIFKAQPYFNSFAFDLLFSNLRRCLSQFHYTTLLRYLFIIESRKDCEVIGPLIYLNKSYDKNFETSKPLNLVLKIPEEIFYFILRLLPDKQRIT